MIYVFPIVIGVLGAVLVVILLRRILEVNKALKLKRHRATDDSAGAEVIGSSSSVTRKNIK